MKSTKYNFPDPEYLKGLVDALKNKVESNQSVEEQLVLYSSAALTWISDIVSDPNTKWRFEEVRLEDLYLTGTNPEWNTVIIDDCNRNVSVLKERIDSNKAVAALFKDVLYSDIPILLHEKEGGVLAVFDGMHRVVAAIRDGKSHIKAYIAKTSDPITGECEPHVVYDLIKAYQRSNRSLAEKQQLVGALTLLSNAYLNVQVLIKERFNKDWIKDDEIQEILSQVYLA